jgi:alpha-aminoadipate carrier protein LysW
MNQTVECVECGAAVQIAAGAMLGEILPCRDCGAELEIISLTPPQVDLAPLEMEDWGE